MAKRILLIEDDKILSEMFVEKFKKMGFNIDLALTAEQGLGLLKTKPKPDLILLDILLPKHDGIHFLKKIKEQPKLAEVPVVVASNYQDTQTIKDSYALGVKEYLLKTDYTPGQLVKKVEKYL